MKQTDACLQNTQEISAAKRPAILQQNVVLLLDTDSGELAQHIERVRQILKLNELDLPVSLLLGDDGLQGHGGIAMPPAAVVENDMDFFHCGDSDTGSADSTRAHSMPCG